MPDSKGLLAEVIRQTDALTKRKEAIDTQLGEIEPDLKKAIEQVDGPSVETYAAALRHEVTRVEDTLESARRILVDIHELQKDEAFVADNIIIVGTATRTVSKIRDDLTHASERCDGLLEAAEKARKDSLKTADHAQRGLAQLRMWQRQDEDRAKKIHAEAEAIAQKAMEAVEARDETALDAQRKAFDRLSIGVLKEEPARNRVRIQEWSDRSIGKGLGETVDRELKDEVKQLLAKVDDMEQRWIAPLEKLSAKVNAAVIAEIDARKAAQALQIDAKLAAKLGAVLNDTPAKGLEKALDAFVKQNKLGKLTGKQMLADLRKARLLK